MTLEGNSRRVTSNQNGVHDDLEAVVTKHLSTEFKKPYAEFSVVTFNAMSDLVEQFLATNPNGKLILDSCCGVGESTYHLAQQHPECLVLGIDKSEHRIEKQPHHIEQQLDNCHLFRGDLNDLWRLIAAQNWPILWHYILYPNPWPKSKHLGRRWHGSPVFKNIPKLSEKLVVRSNWQTYIDEFAVALKMAGISAQVQQYQNDVAMTPFERKYWASGQLSYQLTAYLK